jgi:hypothetical protein
MEEQLGSNWTERQRRFANTNLVVQAVGSKWVSSTSVHVLHCFVNASILAKPMDLIWKRDFVSDSTSSCKVSEDCSLRGQSLFFTEARKT